MFLYTVGCTSYIDGPINNTQRRHAAHAFSPLFVLRTIHASRAFSQVVCRYIIILQAEGIEHSLGRMYLTYCILALALGDYVRADAAFRDEHLQSTV